MKEINLTQGQVALVDDEDYDYLNQWKWYLRTGHSVYAQRGGMVNKVRYYYYMHRVILGVTGDTQVDHIDGNGLNNQRHNLRLCSHGQNQMNRKAWGVSPYLGVSLCKGKYFCKIKVNKKQIYLGLYDKEIDAAIAYDVAAVKYHGKFARLNFPVNNIN